MGLIHVCTDQQPHVWRQLGANAKLSGVPLRDFLSYLILTSAPIPEDGSPAHLKLLNIAETNKAARSLTSARTNRARTFCTSFNERDEGTAGNERAEPVNQETAVEDFSSGFRWKKARQPSALDLLKQHMASAETVEHAPAKETGNESDPV